MFCKKCGAEIDDEAVVCPKCGCATDNNKPENKTLYMALCIAGFAVSALGVIFTALIPLVCLILGCIGVTLSQIGRRMAKKADDKTMAKLGLSGMIIGIADMAAYFIILIANLIIVSTM